MKLRTNAGVGLGTKVKWGNILGTDKKFLNVDIVPMGKKDPVYCLAVQFDEDDLEVLEKIVMDIKKPIDYKAGKSFKDTNFFDYWGR